MFAEVPGIVSSWFVAHSIDANVVEGVEEHVAQDNFGPGTANRVAFVPAEGPYEIVEAQFPGDGATGRQLSNILIELEVYIAAFDQANPKRDLMHMRQAIALYEAIEQAMQHAYPGSFHLSAPGLNNKKRHLRHGVELVASLVVNTPIFDVASPSATATPLPGEPKPAAVEEEEEEEP